MELERDKKDKFDISEIEEDTSWDKIMTGDDGTKDYVLEGRELFLLHIIREIQRFLSS